MTKSETMRQLAAASNAAQLDTLARTIENLHSSRLASAEELAVTLEQLAQAMAALTDETRQTLETIKLDGTAQGERFRTQIEAAVTAWRNAENAARQAAEAMNRKAHETTRHRYLLAATVGLLTGLLVSVLWLWLAPAPKIQNALNAKEVAELIKPEIAALNQRGCR